MSADSKLSAQEMVQSLTGFDEIAIDKHMGIDPYADGERKPIAVLRALVFVQKTREGLSAPAAKDVAMGMSMQDVQDSFEDEADDVDPEQPDSDQGKDDEQHS